MAGKSVIPVNASGKYVLSNVASADILKIDIVDVDIVVRTKDGGVYVLPGAGIGSMSEEPPSVAFSDREIRADVLMESLGTSLRVADDAASLTSANSSDMSSGKDSKEEIKKAVDKALKEAKAEFQKQLEEVQKEAQKEEHKEDKKHDEQHDQVASVPVNAEASVEATVAKAQKIVENLHVSDYDYVPPHEFKPPPGASASPPGQPAPLSLTPVITLFMGNVVGTTYDTTTSPGTTIIYGAGGAVGSDSSAHIGPRNALQFSTASIVGTGGNDLIYAQGPALGNPNPAVNATMYAKEFNLNVAGYFVTLHDIIFSSVPAGITIVGATDNGGGKWTLPASYVTGNQSFSMIYDGTSTGTFNILIDISGDTTRGSVFASQQSFRFQYMDVTNTSQVTDPSLIYENVNGHLSEIYILPTQDQPNLIAAGAGNDSIYGGRNNDTITGGDGDNLIVAKEGSDTVALGNGNNNVDLGAGNNIATTGTGNDIIVATDGNNVIDAGNGTNSVTLGNGNNAVTTGSGNDHIAFLDGKNTIVGGDGNNTISGGVGLAMITTGIGNDSITLTSGGGTINAGAGANNISVGGGDYTITTLGGSDTILAGAGIHIIDAGDGNNSITGGAGAATIIGGLGNDVITLTSGGGSINAGAGVNIINVGDGNYTITTLGGADTIVAGIGTHVIDAGDGNNSITGGAGAATITGGSGNDVITLASGGGTINAGAGANNISVGGGDYVITTGSGADTIFAGIGKHTIDGGDGNNSITVGASTTTNLITTGSGNDTLVGSTGNELFSAGLGTNVITSGGGIDMVDYGTITTTGITASLATGLVTGTSLSDTLVGISNLTGTGLADTITGSTAANLIYGGDGNDSIVGNGGNDTLYGGNGNDTITGNAGVDLIYGGDGNNSISGGSAGADSLYGGSGNDTFINNHAGTRYNGTNGANMAVGEVNSIDYSSDTLGMTVNLSSGLGYGGLADNSGYAFTPTAGINSINKIIGGSGSDSLIGSSGNDYLDGGSNGNDTLIGGAGNNTLVGGPGGTDVYSMGGGYDTIVGSTSSYDYLGYSSSGAGVVINLTNADQSYVNSAGVTRTVLAYSGSNFGVTAADANSFSNGDYYTPVSGAWTSIDRINGSGSADLIYVGSGNTLGYYNYGGNDTLYGSTASVGYYGYEQRDFFYGGSGGDTYYWSNGADRADGGTGYNLLRTLAHYTGSNFNAVVYLDATADTNGNSIADYIDRGVTTLIDAANGGTYTGFEYGWNNATNGANATLIRNFDNILGNAANEYFVGNANANDINAIGGFNTIFGGAGNDTITAIDGTNTIDGGAGTHDLINFQYATNGISGALGSSGSNYTGDTLNGGVQVFLSDGTFTGASDKTSLWGVGNGTNAQARTGPSGAYLYDVITNVEDINGSDQNDTLYGNASANIIYGNGSNDIIAGNGGGDSLYGGAGNDLFRVTSTDLANVVVFDGGTGTDTIYSPGFTFAAGAFSGSDAKYVGIEVLDARNTAASGGYSLSAADIRALADTANTSTVTLNLDATGDTFTASTTGSNHVDQTGSGSDFTYKYYSTVGTGNLIATLNVHYGP